MRSQLANAGVAEALIDTLVGHEVAGSTGAKVYTHRTPQTLAEAIGLIHYPSLAIKVIYQPRHTQHAEKIL